MDIFKDNACFFTGHRKIPRSVFPLLANLLEKTCTLLITKYGITDFITGGALGFDTLAAQTILRLKKTYNVRLHLFIPCIDQTKWWSPQDIEIWNSINNAADSVRYISNYKYTHGCMQQRNRAMVDSATFFLAYCTQPSGGTYYTLKYAKSKNRAGIVFTSPCSSLDDFPFTLIEM